MARFLASLLLLFSFGVHAGPLDPDFETLERALTLKPSQKIQFDVAVGATRRALLGVGLSGLQIKDRVAAELAKPRPDLNVIYEIHEQVVEQNKPLFREAKDEWSRLYPLLDDEQVAIARRYVESKLSLLLR